MAPAAFASMLTDGVERGSIKFTNRGDVGLVASIYERAFDMEMTDVVRLDYRGLGWADEQLDTLMDALRAAASGGGLTRLEELWLNSNEFSDAGVQRLAGCLDIMPALAHLDVFGNSLSDTGKEEIRAVCRARGVLCDA